MTEFPARTIAIAAYRALLHGLGRFVWLGGAWMTCALACLVVDLLPWPTGLFRVLVLLSVLVMAAASAAVSVSWFRALLLDETYYGAMPMKFAARQFRYLVYQSVIAAILSAPIALFCFIVRADSWWAAAYSFVLGGSWEGKALGMLAGSILAAMFGLILSLKIAARLMLALAAVALDETGPLFLACWHRTQNDAPALFYGWIGCILPVPALWTITATVLTRTISDDIAWPILDLLAYLCYFLALGLTVGFFACTFAHYTEGELTDEGADATSLVAARE